MDTTLLGTLHLDSEVATTHTIHYCMQQTLWRLEADSIRIVMSPRQVRGRPHMHSHV